jgi:hypothetical protein
VDAWQQARGVTHNMFYELERKHEQIRQQRLDAWVQKHKDLVYRSVERWVWRYRWRMPVTELVKHHEQIRWKRLDTWTQTYKALMATPVGRWAWRIRFGKALILIKHKFFWRAYYLAHPEEKEEMQEEMTAFFMIDV